MGETANELVGGDGKAWSHDALRQRVSVLAAGIVLVRDIPVHSGDTWRFMSDHLEKLGQEFDKYVLILDLTEGEQRPKGAYREAIQDTLNNVITAKHVALVQVGSPLLRPFMRFAAKAFLKSGSVHATLEEALTEARARLET